MLGKLKNYNRDELQKIVNESTSYSEVVLKIGYKRTGGGYNAEVKKFLLDNNFDVSSLVGRHLKKIDNTGISKKWLSEILCENGSGNSNYIKKKLLEWGVKEYKCENPKCGITEWHGEDIVLQLHHINGNHYDNRLENLVLLCPNCHSQTTNFCGKHLNEELSKIAISESKMAIENLLEQEAKRKAEILENRKKNGNYTKEERLERQKQKEKNKKYCKTCGNEIHGRGKTFCSVKCMIEYQQKNSGVAVDDIIEKSKIVSSFVELAKCFNMSDNGIRKRLKTAGKLDVVRKNIDINRRDFSVIQYSIDNKMIKEWNNGREAGTALGINISKIYRCCNGKQKTCGGFIWKFKK